MIMSPENLDKQQLMAAILSRAATDLAFRSGLLSDPRRTIEDAFAVVVPGGYRVRFIEKGPDLDALVVLPDARPAQAELTDSDLDSVRGGTGPDPFGLAAWSA
jgi:hypothetical protein